MTFVVTDNCQRCRFTDCVAVCPVDCFHGDDEMLYIDPNECIDCGACKPECPIDAIVDAPEKDQYWAQINANLGPVYKGQKGPVRPKTEKPRRPDNKLVAG